MLFVCCDRTVQQSVRNSLVDHEALQETPFGQLPVLDVDGTQIAQSLAICRYLARKFGFAGKSPKDEAFVDMLADQYTDYRTEIKPWLYVAAGMKEGNAEELKKDVFMPARKKYLDIITKFLKQNKSGFLVGDSVTWVDLLVAEHSSTMLHFDAKFVEGYPEVKAHMEKIQAIPNIKKWIETRPKTDF
ncbi:unnamed protein product [Cylicostephanus goldi]|uniref:glutathione transferase n=1 Tax=Cylicostephanus goldi TaxID=71465 RepID=A0A3P7MA47_CYLGO|nr:unnamed protein product [Cylicostephanus goldi]